MMGGPRMASINFAHNNNLKPFRKVRRFGMKGYSNGISNDIPHRYHAL